MMMKKYGLIIKVLLISMFAILLNGCENSLTSEFSSKANEAKFYTITGNIDVDAISAENSSRTGLPTIPSINDNSINFSVSATKDGETITGTVSGMQYSITLPKGSWTITVIGKKNEVNVLEGSINVNPEEPTTQQTITLKTINAGTGTGSLSLTITKDSGLSCGVVKATLYKTSTDITEKNLTFDTTNSTTWDVKDLNAGTYEIKLDFYQTMTLNADGTSYENLLYSHHDTVNIFANLVTNTWTGSGYTENSFKLTQTMITSFAMSTFYVDGTNGDDSKAGTYFAPFKTLQAAVNKVIEMNKVSSSNENAPYRILLLSDVTDTSTGEDIDTNDGSLISIKNYSNLGLYLKIASYQNDSCFEIKGASGRRIMNIEEGANVTIENITLTGGKITLSGGSGGGVQVAGGTFTMKNNATISGCTAEKGGGVYVQSGTFTMESGAISDCSANVGGAVYVAHNKNSQFAATFEMSGGAYVNFNNDVYLANGTTITVTGNLTSTDTVATITPEKYEVGTQVLTPGSGVTLANQVGKFTIANEGYYIDENGMLGKESKVESWGSLSSTLSDSSATRILLTEDLTATTTINVSTEVEILATKDVTITRNSNFTGAFFNNTSTLTLGDGTYTITLDGGKNSNINAQAPLIQSGGEGASLTLNNCNLQNNKNMSTTGGAISISGGTFTMNGGVIGTKITENDGNKQSWEYVADESKCSNYAKEGGGIYVADGTVTIKNAKVSYNYVGDDVYSSELHGGGGISIEKGNLTLEDTEVSYNRGWLGGGVRCYGGDTKNAGTLTLKHATIKGNAGKYANSNNYGGGLVVQYFELICDELTEASIIEENYSADGGAVFLEKTTSTLNNITIQNNTRAASGGHNFGTEMLLFNKANISIGSSNVTIVSSDKDDDKGIYFSADMPNTNTLKLFGDVKLATPIYLASGEKITIGELTSEGTVATITPAAYTVGTQVLVAEDGVNLADQVGKFAVTPNGATINWTIDNNGYLKK